MSSANQRSTRHEVWSARRNQALAKNGPVNPVRLFNGEQRGVTGRVIVAPNNGYRTSTYTRAYNCVTASWSAATLVSTTCVTSLPVGVNTWAYTTGCSAQGTFAAALGNGDFDCLVGHC